MKRLVPYAVAAGIVLFAAAMTFVILRGEDTRERVRVVERGAGTACVRGDDKACRKLAAALARYLRSRGEKNLPDFRRPSAGGGGAVGDTPSGGGPIGRVPGPGSPGGSPPESSSPEPPGGSEPDEPAVDLDVPLVPKVCVSDLLGVNCP